MQSFNFMRYKLIFKIFLLYKMDQTPDFAQIMKIAQQVASQIETPAGLTKGGEMNPEEMTKVLGQITKSVGEIVTPEMLASSFGTQPDIKTNNKKKKKSITSKISFDSTGLEDVTDVVPPDTKEKPEKIVKATEKGTDKKKKRYDQK